MTLTYIQLLGIVIALTYFIASFFANRIERFAFENATRDEQFIISEARPNEDEFGMMQTLVSFLIAIGLAYLVNTFKFLIPNSRGDLVGIVTVIMTVAIMDWRERRSGEYQRNKLQQERVEIASTYLTQTYLNAERKATWLSMAPLIVFFVYLVIVY